MMNVIKLLLMFIVLVGCAVKPINYYDGKLTKNIKVIDQRPEEQKKTKNMSLSITNCMYGIYQFGDDHFLPDRISWLSHKLSTEKDIKIKFTEIELINFTFHRNVAKANRRSVGAMYSGAIANLMNDKSVTGCSADDLFGGYVASESDDPWGPIVVVIDIKINGSFFHGRAVSPVGSPESTKNPKWNVLVNDALNNAFKDLVVKINYSK